MIRVFVCRAAIVASLAFGLAGSAFAQNDRIKVRSETSQVQGTVEAVTRDEVVVSTQARARTIPASDVEIIFYGGQQDLQRAQIAAAKGDYKEATERLDAVHLGDQEREPVKAEVAFMQALIPAKIALSGQTQTDDDGNPVDPAAAAISAGKKMLGFVNDKHHANSFHYYEANEIIGDLYMSLGQYDRAEEFYKKLSESKSADVKARANLLRGRAMQVAGKYDEALAAYDAVLKTELKGKVGAQEMLEAKIGRTYSLASSGKVDEAIKTLQEIIAKADDDDTETLARAYDALGNCYRKQKDSKQALWAYLRVHLLYGSVPEAHAEALANLVVLWNEAKRSDRAREARDYLQQHYPYSRWNKQIR
jgi:tetratricopeptide (TPR) repeat protein